MSRPNTYPRPPKPRGVPTPGSESSDGASPPVPAPRRGGVRQSSNLPNWPPVANAASPPSPVPSKIDQRPPAPLPPAPSSPVPSLPSRDTGSFSRPPDIPPATMSPSPPVATHTPALTKSQVAFGSCLQQAHDAINKRHDDELHALESFRAHVFFRAKADREYAQELAKINTRANKTLSAVSHSSPIIQVTGSADTTCFPQTPLCEVHTVVPL